MEINEKILQKGIRINEVYLVVFIAATLFVYFQWQSQWYYWIPLGLMLSTVVSIAGLIITKNAFACTQDSTLSEAEKAQMMTQSHLNRSILWGVFFFIGSIILAIAMYNRWQDAWYYWVPTVFAVLSVFSLSIRFRSKKYFSNQS